jgi:hypothetical protein
MSWCLRLAKKRRRFIRWTSAVKFLAGGVKLGQIACKGRVARLPFRQLYSVAARKSIEEVG